MGVIFVKSGEEQVDYRLEMNIFRKVTRSGVRVKSQC